MITLIYRSHYAGPLSKRVTRLRADSVLGWFQHAWGATLSDPDWVDRETGGMYGFRSIFDTAREKQLPIPRSIPELRALLDEYLYVEGGSENILLDAHRLRVLTDDDEVDLAYFFFDDHVPADQVAWMLHETVSLPEVIEGNGGWAPPEDVSVHPLLPAGTGAGQTYAVLLTFYDGMSMPQRAPVVFPGTRLPGFIAHIEGVQPHAVPKRKPWGYPYIDTWPDELRVLRVLAEGDLRHGLLKVAHFPMNAFGGQVTHHLGNGPLDVSRQEILDFASDLPPNSGDPEQSLIDVGQHAALFCHHAHRVFGYQQWVLFDDVWAAAYPDLAASLLRYGDRWDPMVPPPEPVELSADPAPLPPLPTPPLEPQAEGALATVLSVAQQYARLRIDRINALQDGVRELSVLNALEALPSIPPARQVVTASDIIAALRREAIAHMPLDTLPWKTDDALPIVTEALPICTAILRRWVRPATVESLIRALASELGLNPPLEVYHEGLITMEEARNKIIEHLIEVPAPIAAPFWDRDGACAAAKAGLERFDRVWLDGPSGIEQRWIQEALGERVVLERAQIPDDATFGQVKTTAPNASQVLRILCLHAPLIADRWRVDWGASALLSTLDASLRAGVAFSDLGHLLSDQYHRASQNGRATPEALRVRSQHPISEPCAVERLMAGYPPPTLAERRSIHRHVRTFRAEPERLHERFSHRELHPLSVEDLRLVLNALP